MVMDILLTIKPQYAIMIFEKQKCYEFRRRFTRKKIGKVVVYASKPFKKIMGFFTVKKVLKDHPAQLWEICKDAAGVGKDFFFQYFKDKTIGFALVIDQVIFFTRPIDPYELNFPFHWPQSYSFLHDKSPLLAYINQYKFRKVVVADSNNPLVLH